MENFHFGVWIGNSVNLLKIWVPRNKEFKKERKKKLGSEMSVNTFVNLPRFSIQLPKF